MAPPSGSTFKKRPHERFRIEGRQIFGLLSDAHVEDRQTEFAGNRHYDPALRRAVQFRQDEAGHSRGFGELPGLLQSILARDRIKRSIVAAALALMASTYIAGAAAVIALGASEDEEDGQAAATASANLPTPPK